MAELNGRYRAHVLQEVGDAPVGTHMLVRINAGAVMGAAPARFNRSFFATNNPGTADCELPAMDELPIRHRPIDRQRLRHRTEHDPVARRHTTQRQWAKQQRAFSDWRSKATWMLGN